MYACARVRMHVCMSMSMSMLVPMSMSVSDLYVYASRYMDTGPWMLGSVQGRRRSNKVRARNSIAPSSKTRPATSQANWQAPLGCCGLHAPPTKFHDMMLEFTKAIRVIRARKDAKGEKGDKGDKEAEH